MASPGASTTDAASPSMLEAAVRVSPGALQRRLVQRRLVQRRAHGEAAETSPATTQTIAAAGVAGAGHAMPHLDTIQRSFGRHDVSFVQAHVGGAAGHAAEAIAAEAYATGDAVAFRRAPDLHTAAHEAAHVVQQRGGVQLKGGLGEEGDPHERHADAVADAVVRGASAEGLLDQYQQQGRSGAAVQRRAATEADVPGAQRDGTGSLFDSKIPSGHNFTVRDALPAPDYNSVIARYHEVIRPIGTAVAARGFLDQRFTFPNSLPGERTWGAKKRDYVEGTVIPQLALVNTDLTTHPQRDFWAQLATDARAPAALADRPEIGLLDPFTVTLEIGDSSKPVQPAWRLVTQFSHSACGYITKIYNGAQNFGGEIATGDAFKAARNTAKASDTDFKYSSTHDQGESSFQERIGKLDPKGANVGDNGAGFDAVTWVAAEGARFAPIAALGTAGTPMSHYFVKPQAESWAGYRYLTASDLMQSWKVGFHQAYDIPTAAVRALVEDRGKTDAAQPPKGVHFDLGAGVRHDQA